MKTFYTLLFISYCAINLKAQDSELPYYEIPPYPETYTAETAIARMIDGLGFRYYWATEGLTEKDLDYKPSEDGRSVAETLDHIYGLSQVVLNGVKSQVNDFPDDFQKITFDEKRKNTLSNIYQASEMLKSKNPGEIAALKSIFKNGDSTSELPFWNLINGPIEDAIYHTGQIVLLRRASGNPISPNLSMMMGKKRE
jgi:uncharacterized damage-inducible protein DinB